MKSALNYVLTFFLFLSACSCHHNADLSVEPPKPPPPGPEFKCSHDTIYFQNSVFPVILSGCAKTGCHDNNTRKGDVVLESYADIKQRVVPFNPTSSELYIILFSNSEGRMPPDAPFSMEKKSIIYWWIKQGAFNNRCDSTGCDSTVISFTSSVNPIIQSWCSGCHGGSDPANGLRLETYDQVAACANSGRLMGSLRHETGYYPMPKNAEILSPCQISLFQKWIDLGKPL